MNEMSQFTKDILEAIQEAQDEIGYVPKPPSEGEIPANSLVVDFLLVQNTRGYIEKTVHQINGCYEHGWYDACAVMLRKLIETLIIEAFENNGIQAKIKMTDGNYIALDELVTKTLDETSWSLGRNAKQALPKLKHLGNESAHSRRFNARRNDLEKLLPEIRTAVEELLYVANLKK